MDLGPVERITVGTRGEPGNRTFFLQARTDTGLLTVVCEKEQVRLLSSSILELVASLSLDPNRVAEPDVLATGSAGPGLQEPLEPRWRVGEISLGYDEVRDLFLLELVELRLPDPDVDPDVVPDDPASLIEDQPETVRLWTGLDELLALSRHGAGAVTGGRPTCQLCGNPIDPEGHTCPATNGHTPHA
jgi:uncharacterized repeat protein (TIGR03847 family)